MHKIDFNVLQPIQLILEKIMLDGTEIGNLYLGFSILFSFFKFGEFLYQYMSIFCRYQK